MAAIDMGVLCEADLAALLRLVRESAAHGDPDAFRADVLARLGRLVPAEVVSYSEVDPGRPDSTWVSEPSGAGDPAVAPPARRLRDRHPLVEHHRRTGDGHTLKVSDFLSDRHADRLEPPDWFLRPLGIHHQMAFTVAAHFPMVAGIVFSRTDQDFSERDRIVLDLVRPHVGQGYRDAEARSVLRQALAGLEAAASSGGPAIVLLDRHGGIRSTTDAADHRLREWFGHAEPGSAGLPEAVARWLAAQRARLCGAAETPPPAEPLVVERPGERLVVRFVLGATPDEDLLVLRLRRDGVPAAALAAALGLARREAEVLAWVARGKTDGEIATALSLSPRTVQRHVEHICHRLGVATRTAAATRAFEVAAGP